MGKVKLFTISILFTMIGLLLVLESRKSNFREVLSKISNQAVRTMHISIPHRLVKRHLASCMDSIELSSITGEVLQAPSMPVSESSFLSDAKSINELLPEKIDKKENGYKVMGKIADRGFQKFISSEQFKSSSLGKLNEEVKEKTKVDLNIRTENKLEHKLSFKLEPFQQGATVDYSGYFGVQFSYYEKESVKKLKVDDILFSKNIYFENYLSSSDRWNQVGFQWKW